MTVTVQEIVEALKWVGPDFQNPRPYLAHRVEREGIAPPEGYAIVPIVFLETIYGMSMLGAETPNVAYRWCERIHDTFCMPHDDEYHDHKQPLPEAMLTAAPKPEVKP